MNSAQGTRQRLVSCALVFAAAAQSIRAPLQRSGSPGPPPSDAPNVLVIVLDDVGADKLEAFDRALAPPYAVTPRLDLLARGDLASNGDGQLRGGIRFQDFYVTPVCSPSRACFQTGRYGFRTGMGYITDNGSPDNPPSAPSYLLPDSEVTLAELLKKGFFPQRSPYRCGAFGKWHLAYDYVDSSDYFGINGAESHAVDNGYDCFFGTVGNVAGAKPVFDGVLDDHFSWRKVEQTAGGAPIIRHVDEWSADTVRADAASWIDAETHAFFAWVAFNPPHAPFQVPPYELLSEATRLELEALTPGPATIPPSPGDERHKLAAGDPRRPLYHRATLEAVDTEIGMLLDEITPAKLRQTLIFVVCDNGTQMDAIQPGHDATHGKDTVYQLGVRVPMIVAGCLVPPGEHDCDELVEAVDLWPTIGAVAGADADEAFLALGVPSNRVIDGRSFLPFIQDPGRPVTPETCAFGQEFIPNGSPDCPPTNERYITDGRYKYIRRQSSCVALEEEFYDVLADPEEQLDLFLTDPTHPVLLELRSAMLALHPD